MMTEEITRDKILEVMAEEIRNCRHYGRSSEDCSFAALKAIEDMGLVLMPRKITEGLACVMECQFSTEAQWDETVQAFRSQLNTHKGEG